MIKIPRTMSTQHPDNVAIPFFVSNPTLTGDDEVQEAFYVYSHLGIDEQLWDVEGKEVDNYVVHKLLSKYPDYFRQNKLGEQKFLTLRAPNPDIEKNEAKILPELIFSIPRNHDIATAFYQQDTTPIFEIVVPMCNSEKPLVRIHEFYKQFIANYTSQNIGDITLENWLGSFKPENIRVTPLFETKEEILNSHLHVEKYLQHTKIKDFQRVWYARSDPAMNYGSVAAILLVKIALQRLHALEKKLGIELLPIIGLGSAPFRGNFKPSTVKKILEGYPSVQTFTIQSAFKYDNPLKQVIEAVDYINKAERKDPYPVDEQMALRYIDLIHEDYVDTITDIAPLINEFSRYLPGRRKRKIHTGLFGYSRNTSGIKLPRTISFCAVLYSLGIPPEIFGLSKLTEGDINNLKKCYANIEYDMGEALQYLNEDNLIIFPERIQEKIKRTIKLFKYQTNNEHKEATTKILKAYLENNHALVSEWIVHAGKIRGFLG
ncbi:MAG: phosphoenolpyruvate carboxylase [Nanoarchaeota archaeon]